MSEPNLTLLTQEEIDTLVKFLVQNKEGINNEVLNQNSVDKLIYLIENNDLRRLRLDSVNLKPSGESSPKLLVSLGLYENETQTGRLDARVNEESSYLELYAVNRETGKELLLTPDNYAQINLGESTSQWGYSIVPSLFDEIADTYGLKYERKTLEFVCALFADKNFGNKNFTLASAFVPSSKQLLSNILEE